MNRNDLPTVVKSYRNDLPTVVKSYRKMGRKGFTTVLKSYRKGHEVVFSNKGLANGIIKRIDYKDREEVSRTYYAENQTPFANYTEAKEYQASWLAAR